MSGDVRAPGHGGGGRRAGRPLVLGTLLLIVAVLVGGAVRDRAANRKPAVGRPSATVGVPAVDHPSPDVRPSEPGMVVPSGENQSDPFLTIFEGRYFLYTSGVPGLPPVNVPVASSSDFDIWSAVGDALPTLPHWAVPGYTWAPDVHQFGSRYVLYFTAMVVGTQPAQECIGDATGTAPAGPFTPRPTPFICQTSLGGSIDPRVFTAADGRSWMLWKSDQNIDGSSRPTQMWSQELTPDGLGLTGRTAVIMHPDEPWQGSIVEAPDMVAVDGTVWVFYSGNWFNQPGYAIGAARCAGPLGPCSDQSPLPLLGSNGQGQGPGEASVFADGDGIWLLYSPWRSQVAKPIYPPRPVFITRLGFAPSGPYLASGGPPPDLDPFVSGLMPFS